MRQIGRYEVLKTLGQGGMGVVYLARDPRFDRHIALKMLPRQLSVDETYRARFEREARTIAGLGHSAIVPVHDFGEYEGQLYLVMAFMSGGSLADRIYRIGEISTIQVRPMLKRVASALDAAHEKGIIHRDIKPANILFDSYDEAFLSDFGIVKVADASTDLTQGIIGTPYYLAPEMLQDGGLSNLIDVYSLGVTVYEALTGRRPYVGETYPAVIYAHANKPIPDIRNLRTDLTAPVAEVIKKSMAKEPELRYQSAGEFAEAFEEALVSEQTSAEVEAESNLALEPIPLHTQAIDTIDNQPLSEALNEGEKITSPSQSSNVASIEEELDKPEPAAKPKRKTRLPVIVVILLLIGIGTAGGAYGLGFLGEVPNINGTLATISEQPVGLEGDLADTESGVVEAMPSPVAEASQEVETSGEEGETGPIAVVTEDSNVPAEEQLALAGVDANDDWVPYTRVFNDVEMALVPASCFTMGEINRNINEQPEHTVCFEEPFWIDIFEVTNEQLGESTCLETSSDPQQPRICVSWVEADAHCAARASRLPTEAEWEYAARGPDGLSYPWGEVFASENAVYQGNNRLGQPSIVGSRPGGASWVGALDMSGNVWEWVNDWYSRTYYDVSPEVNPQGPTAGEDKVVRGGSWDFDEDNLRLTNRFWESPDSRFLNYGFRCAAPYTLGE